ncbi:DUF2332 family protein [Achromobacter pulmonis]|uniref:DUF2332 family protein n=1 Tax=Achromobacter pulmonis TaxID=1389932 RepID=UPI00280C018A|nr:DUF2332 family protein [Achromobacter pulmonis]
MSSGPLFPIGLPQRNVCAPYISPIFCSCLDIHPIAERYLRFARNEAAGRSPLHEQWARHVAQLASVLAYLEALPAPKGQPNLLFAALRHAAGTPASAAEFDARLTQHGAGIRARMLARSSDMKSLSGNQNRSQRP